MGLFVVTCFFISRLLHCVYLIYFLLFIYVSTFGMVHLETSQCRHCYDDAQSCVV
jgi:hypothetical protein